MTGLFCMVDSTTGHAMLYRQKDMDLIPVFEKGYYVYYNVEM